MTNLELIKQCQNGTQMEYVTFMLGSGCLQSAYARKGDKENERKTWRGHCQRTRCQDCRNNFWDQESVYKDLNEIGVKLLSEVKKYEETI